MSDKDQALHKVDLSSVEERVLAVMQPGADALAADAHSDAGRQRQKIADHLKAYGAGEIKIAQITGQYPPSSTAERRYLRARAKLLTGAAEKFNDALAVLGAEIELVILKAGGEEAIFGQQAVEDKNYTATTGGVTFMNEEHLTSLLKDAERFISGFEDDEMQEGIAPLLARLRKAINR